MEAHGYNELALDSVNNNFESTIQESKRADEELPEGSIADGEVSAAAEGVRQLTM